MNFSNDPTLTDVRELYLQWRHVLHTYTNTNRVQSHDVSHAAIFFTGMTIGNILSPVQDPAQREKAIDHHLAMLREYIEHGLRISEKMTQTPE